MISLHLLLDFGVALHLLQKVLSYIMHVLLELFYCFFDVRHPFVKTLVNASNLCIEILLTENIFIDIFWKIALFTSFLLDVAFLYFLHLLHLLLKVIKLFVGSVLV